MTKKNVQNEGGGWFSGKIYNKNDSVINTDNDKTDIADKITELVTKYNVTFDNTNSKEQYFFQCYLKNSCGSLGLEHNDNIDKNKATIYLNKLISKINNDDDLKIANNIKRLLIKANLVNDDDDEVNNINTAKEIGGKKRTKQTRGKKIKKGGKKAKRTAKKMRS